MLVVRKQEEAEKIGDLVKKRRTINYGVPLLKNFEFICGNALSSRMVADLGIGVLSCCITTWAGRMALACKHRNSGLILASKIEATSQFTGLPLSGRIR